MEKRNCDIIIPDNSRIESDAAIDRCAIHMQAVACAFHWQSLDLLVN